MYKGTTITITINSTESGFVNTGHPIEYPVSNFQFSVSYEFRYSDTLSGTAALFTTFRKNFSHSIAFRARAADPLVLFEQFRPFLIRVQ